MRKVVVIVLVLVAALIAWIALRDGGGVSEPAPAETASSDTAPDSPERERVRVDAREPVTPRVEEEPPAAAEPAAETTPEDESAGVLLVVDGATAEPIPGVVAQFLELAFRVANHEAWNRVVCGINDRRTAIVVELEQAITDWFDRRQARQASTPPDLRRQVISKPRGAQRLRGVEPEVPAGAPVFTH